MYGYEFIKTVEQFNEWAKGRVFVEEKHITDFPPYYVKENHGLLDIIGHMDVLRAVEEFEEYIQESKERLDKLKIDDTITHE